MTLAFSRNVTTERQNEGKWELAVRKDLRVVLQKQILCGNELKEKPSWSFSSWFTKPRHRRATALIGWSSQNRLAVCASQSSKNWACHLGSWKLPVQRNATPEQVWCILHSAQGSGTIHHAAKIRSCLEGMIYYWLHNKDSHISQEKQKGEIYLGVGQIHPWYEKWIH